VEEKRKTGIADDSREATLIPRLEANPPVFTRVLRHLNPPQYDCGGLISPATGLWVEAMVDSAQIILRFNKYFGHDEERCRGKLYLKQREEYWVWTNSAYCILLGLAFRSGANADSYAYVIELQWRCTVKRTTDLTL